MTTLQVGDQTLDYVQHSDGDTPLIFIHGILSSQRTWLDFPQRFAGYGRVITLSLPGHYPAKFPSAMRQETITDSWVGDTVAEAIQQITGGKPAILIGHSTGGYTSLAVAWRAPHLVKSVISLAGFSRGTWTGILGLLQDLRYLGPVGVPLFNALITVNNRTPFLVDAAWRMTSYDAATFRANTTYQQMRPQLMEHIHRIDAHSMRLWFYQMHKEADLTPYLPQITVPVLAIAGKQDSLVPPVQAEIIASNVADGTCLLLDKMNHATFFEQPERVYNCIIEWLATRHEEILDS